MYVANVKGGLSPKIYWMRGIPPSLTVDLPNLHVNLPVTSFIEFLLLVLT